MGYVHDTAMSLFIPPTLVHFVSATALNTWVAGQKADTIVAHTSYVNETTLINIPIIVPSNSVALKGAYLKSIEIDYEVLAGEPTSIAFVINKITRNVDGTPPTVDALPHTATLTAATCKTVNEHRNVLTITTPIWIKNTEEVLVEITRVAGAGANTFDVLGAFANYTIRI